jgi:iron complex transport system ATP-binding protein
VTGQRLLLEDLSVGYRRPGLKGSIRGGNGSRSVVSGIDVSLDGGLFACLVGENGSGKSTLLRTIAGMQRPLSGRALIDGEDVARMTVGERSRRIAVVLTDPVDSGYLTVRGLVALGRYPYVDWKARLSDSDETAVTKALEAIGIGQLADSRVDRLSDGERQKAMIARALAQDTPVILLDEPTAFLDAPRKIEIVSILREVARREGRVVLMSSHDIELALAYADRLWAVSEGRLSSGAPESLVLSGVLASTYRSATASFDLESGSFLVPGKPGRPVGLRGEGIAREWTARALERAGFRVADTGKTGTAEPPFVEVEGERGALSWRIATGNGTVTAPDIEGMLAALGEPPPR